MILISLLAAANLLGGSPPPAVKSAPMIFVETTYPGASATVVADTVAAVIEQQVNGVQDSLHLMSRCTNDGKYILAVSFKPGTNLENAQTLVHNRVSLAMPILPAIVTHEGITVRKKSPLLMLINLSSPDGSYDTLYLSNYARVNIKDELTRVAGVAEIAGFGMRENVFHILLDADKLATHELAPLDVLKALETQKVKIGAGKIGEPPAGQGFQLTINMGRLDDPADSADIIIKTDAKKKIIRLKDVGRVEKGKDTAESSASYNGKPGVLLAVYPIEGTRPTEIGKTVADKMTALGVRFPKGIRSKIIFQAPDPECLLLDVHLPDGASKDRIHDALQRYEKLLRGVKGVQDVLTLTENPIDVFSTEPCILVRLAPAGERNIKRPEVIQSIRTAFEKIPEAAIRVRDLSSSGSITLTVSGPEPDKTQALAERLGQRLRKTKKLTDVWADRESRPIPQLYLDINRDQAAKLGVNLNDVSNTLQVALGSTQISDPQFGRTWQVVVQVGDKTRDRVADLKQLQIRNNKGEMVRLGSFVTIRDHKGPLAIRRLDLHPVVQVSANPADGVSPMQARTLGEAQFEQARRELRLPADDYRLTWLP
jgi:multidrug efflux pump subunit AcrB